MNKTKWLVYVVKDFLGMLGVWQLDLLSAPYVWDDNHYREIASYFGYKIYMWSTDFYNMCVLAIFIGLFLPEIYEICKYVKQKTSRL